MKRSTRKLVALTLAAAAAVSFLALPAGAKDKGKSSKKPSVSAAAAISLEQAKEIALAHAGVSSADVTFTEAKLDKTKYELEFRSSSAEYEYEVSASDGSILEWEVEQKRSSRPVAKPTAKPTARPAAAKPTVKPTVKPTATPKPSAAASVTLAQAKEIALAHAGVDSEDATFTRAKKDKTEYELKFRDSTASYEYELSVADGSVLEYKMELRNVKSTRPSANTLTKAQAKEIALEHAGVVSEDTVFTQAKLDKTKYELEFNDPTAKYEYEISAADGTVLEYSVEMKRISDDASPDKAAELEGAISPEEAKESALLDAGILDEDGAIQEDVKYVTCYVSWKDHAPYAYVVKFATRAAGQQYYTIDLYDGSVIETSRR